jgi:hypothetical protein
MSCSSSKKWFLEAESPGALDLAPPDVVAHLRSCRSCRRLLRRIRTVEEQWRELPLPSGVNQARDAFLARREARQLPVRAHPRQRNLLRLAVAAAVLLVVGVAGLIITDRLQAEGDLLDRMIDWNLALSQSDDPTERSRLFQKKSEEFAELMRKGDLDEDQQKLAKKLLENAKWLVSNDDPLEEAERFSELADEVVEQLQETKDAQKVDRLASTYSRIAQKGINDNLEQIGNLDRLKPQQQAALNKMLGREAQRLEKLNRSLQQTPARAQKSVRQAVSVTGNHSHQKKKHSKK